MRRNISSFIKSRVLGNNLGLIKSLVLVSALGLGFVSPAWAPPFKLPVILPGPLFQDGLAIVDTLQAQQAGRPNAIRKLGYISGTDSLEIAFVCVTVSFLTAGTGNLAVRFYPTSGRLHSADADGVAEMDVIEVDGTGSSQFFFFGMGEPDGGWNTIVFQNLAGGDMSIAYYAIVY